MEVLTQEEKDEQRLREIESDIKEVLDLMTKRTDRDQATEILDSKRKERDEHHENGQAVFHRQQAGKPFPTTMHTKSHMELADALKHRIKLGRHALKLEDSLKRLVKEQVQILERQLKKVRY